MIKLAKFITFIFHPMVLVAPAVFFIILGSGGDYYLALLWSGITLVFELIVASYILLGIKKGFFSNFDVSKRKQRIYLFPFIILIGAVFFLSLLILNGPKVLLLAISYFIVALVIISLVNLKIKASIHVGSITAALISSIFFFGPIFTPVLVLIPIMAWARIIEKRHTLREAIVGFILGTILAFLGIIIVQYFI